MIVTITDNCIYCGACEAINPEVFIIDDKATVIQENIDKNWEKCIDSALICPVSAIWIDEIY